MRPCRTRIRAPEALLRRYSSYVSSSSRDYNAAVTALNGLQTNFSIVESIRKQGLGANKRSIPDMISWLRRIGYESSDLDVLNPIHIAGTKGKGSTSSFVSSILSQYLPHNRSIHSERLPSAVGLYTSPHLRFVRERIQINGKPISEEAFAICFWDVWDRLEATQPSAPSSGPEEDMTKPVYFRFLTLMAFHYCMQEKVGTAVFECGIGGEYDTTNVLQSPSVTAVTNLGIDHEALLGNTLEQIAWHKAGIFKQNVPAFTVPQPPKAVYVLRERAIERGTSLHVVGEHQEIDQIELGLKGEFQKTNASLAIAISALHLQRLGYSGIPDAYDPSSRLPMEFINGLENTRLGGRCERRPDSKAHDLCWYLDGGHTLDSIDVAARWFASHVDKSDKSRSIRVLIFNQQTRDASALARRLYETLASALDDAHPFTHAIFCPNTTYKDSGYKADLVSINTNKDDISSLKVQQELALTWDRIDSHANVHIVNTIEEAVERARNLANGEVGHILATGSLHLVGGLIEVLEHEVEVNQNR